MRLIIKILCLLPVLFVLACSGDNGPVTSNGGEATEPPTTARIAQTIPSADESLVIERPESLTPRDQIVRNCQLVQAAAEAFAAENHGEYPYTVSSDVTPLGNTLIDFLPDGILMVNPYWKARTEPCDGAAAVQGQTGYVVNVYDGAPRGYTITGCGPNYRWYFFIVREADGSLTSWVNR